ncbi:hypothetical protein Sru01_50400 [Sphaerisporangium rufum]|uniref:Uncharacterized protein n=1 Tax=Sphaerisporangium rufum TaxID=1381558 RepID=A0A919R6A9_9ACTN|nr:hypothetical protein [Sphaerisporangium rufum]GII80058.1 hypothetical protein Sru01_50400 [Sphaerisporangium rufum]
MADPITLAIAGALATGVASTTGEALGQAARDAVATLARRVRERLHARGRAAALEEARADPAAAEPTSRLAGALRQAMDEDPAFAAEVQELWRRVTADGGVANTFTGQARTVVQARDITGDITFN